MQNKFNFIKNNWLIITLLGISFLLRIISINQSFWLDEATSANVVKNLSLIDILFKFAPGDFHPPLYYMVLKLWTSLPFGINEVSLRMLSVVFGVLSVYFLYLIGKILKNKSFGLISAFLLATSALHIYYSQEARMYSMQTLFVLICIYFYLKNLNREKLINWIFFSLSIIVIGFTDYLPLLIIPVIFIHSLVIKKNKKWFINLFLSLSPFVVIFILWFPIFSSQLTSGLSVFSSSPNWWKVLGKFSIKELLLIPIKFITGRIFFEKDIVLLPVFSLYVLIFGLLVPKIIKLSKEYLLGLSWFFIPLVLTILLSFRLSVLSYFRLLFILPAFYLIISYSLESIKVNYKWFFLSLLIVSNLIFASIYLFNPKFHRENWRGLVTFIENDSSFNESVTLFVSDSQMEAYNYYSLGKVKAIPPAQFEPEYKTVWLSRYVQDLFDPKDLVRIELEQSGYDKIQDYDFNGVVVSRYDK